MFLPTDRHDDTRIRQRAIGLVPQLHGGRAMIAAIFLLVNTFGELLPHCLRLTAVWLHCHVILIALAFLVIGPTKAAQPASELAPGSDGGLDPVRHCFTQHHGQSRRLPDTASGSGVQRPASQHRHQYLGIHLWRLLAVADDNAKRVLAYSTANLGLIVACCGINTSWP